MSASPQPSTTSGVSRRSVAKGLAWSVPTVAAVAAAPAFAASATNCSVGTLDWNNAPTVREGNIFSGYRYRFNGGMVPIRLADGRTVYARVTFPTQGTNVGSTGTWDQTIGRRAYGSATGDYTINTTGGRDALVLNQRTDGPATTVKIDFFHDSGATRPLTVFNVTVPLEDFSTATSWYGTWSPETIRKDRSYAEGWAVQGTTSSGATVTATKTSLVNPYTSNRNSTFANIRGSGTPSDPWYFPASLTGGFGESVGGNLQTTFGNAAMQSVTITYGSAELAYGLYGAQGSAIGDITVCA